MRNKMCNKFLIFTVAIVPIDKFSNKSITPPIVNII